jgi:putative transposase
VSANQDTYPVGVMCRLLKVSKSGFYDWQGRALSAHARRDVELTALSHAIYERSHRTYGARRVHAELRTAYGVRVGRKRVARLMRKAGLRGVQKRRFRCTTRAGAPEQWVPDLVERQFVADRPNALWVADVTYVPTAEGFLYLAIVLDVFSRLIVGWAMAARLSSELVQVALRMAYEQRGPEEVIHHSDHGNTPRSPSASVARSSGCVLPWAASAIASTTLWPKACSRLSSVRCWIEITSTPATRHAGRSSRGSRVGIIGIADTRPSGTFHHRSSRGASRESPEAFCRIRGRLPCGEERIEIKSERGGNHKLNAVREIGATPDR